MSEQKSQPQTPPQRRRAASTKSEDATAQVSAVQPLAPPDATSQAISQKPAQLGSAEASFLPLEQQSENAELEALLKEYELAVSRLDGSQNRVFQMVGIGPAIIGAIAGYVFQQSNIPVAIAWFAPLIAGIICALIIYAYYFSVNDVWALRALSKRINVLLPGPALISYQPGFPSSTFFSSSRGSLKIRILYGVLFFASAGLFLAIVIAGFQPVYQVSHLSGSLYLLLYSTLFLVLAVAVSGALFDLPQLYRLFLGDEKHFRNPTEFAQTVSNFFRSRSLFAWILPRPIDIVVKGIYFFYGFAAALIMVGFQERQLPLMGFLAPGPANWKTVAEVPGWAVWILAGIYFLVEEGLLQQAKLVWDDIRDVGHDKQLLQNKRRAFASGLLSVKAAICQMIIKWLLAVVLGYWLGGWPLLAVFLIISLHQILYVLWGKRQAASRPRQLLWIVSFNVALRFLAGVIAALGPTWSFTPFVLLFVMFYFYSVGGMAALWKMEPEYQRDIGQPIEIRPQSRFYLDHGSRWQHIGLLAAALVSICLVLVQLEVTSCQNQLPLLADWYGMCSPSGGPLRYVNVGGVEVLALILGLIVAFTLISTLLVLPFVQPVRRLLARGVKKIKGVATFLCFLVGISLLSIALFWGDFTIFLWAFIPINIGYFFNYEGMTYREYTLEALRNRMPWIAKAWYAYLFHPHPKLGLREVLGITFSNVDPSNLL